jgi:hypothetical protein
MAPSFLAMQAANDLISHTAQLMSFKYYFPHHARECIVNSRDVEVSFIWYYILAAWLPPLKCRGEMSSNGAASRKQRARLFLSWVLLQLQLFVQVLPGFAG